MWSRAPSRSAETVPDASLRPEGFALRVGEEIDLTFCAELLAEAGYERVDQVDNFGEAARDAGVERVIYLGGLGDSTSSQHLRSRHEVAELLRQRVPAFVYVRAAMVIGTGSASFEMLRHLTRRLPVMIAPAGSTRAPSPSRSTTSRGRWPTSPSVRTRRRGAARRGRRPHLP